VELCVAKPNLLRCIACFAFPFAALAAYGYKVASVGVNDFTSYLSSVASGGWNAASALFFFGGSLAWILITWPKARAALKSGRCTVSISNDRLWLYGEPLERSDIAAFEIVRRPFDYQLRVRRKDGSAISKSLTLLSPSPDAILATLRDQVA
jgi:hypothetical protein